MQLKAHNQVCNHVSKWLLTQTHAALCTAQLALFSFKSIFTRNVSEYYQQYIHHHIAVEKVSRVARLLGSMPNICAFQIDTENFTANATDGYLTVFIRMCLEMCMLVFTLSDNNLESPLHIAYTQYVQYSSSTVVIRNNQLSPVICCLLQH